MTAGEQLIQQGEQRGEARGIQKGECAVLLRLLRQRFGDQVDSDIEQRLAAASSEQLLTWGDRLLSATTLGELLAD